MSLIVERTEAPGWTSNSYLVADGEGGHAVVIDGNGVTQPLIDRAKELGVTVDAILVTHQHGDHVQGIDDYRAAFGAPVITHEITSAAVPDLRAEKLVAEGDTFAFGGLEITPLLSEGHCAGQLAFVVNGTDVFTADTLFKGTVGGNFAPANTGYADQKDAAMRLAQLPAGTTIHPGHTLPTTAGDEWEQNPFIRIWRGLDPEGEDEVTVWDRPAQLVLWAPDYDGSNKAWVRFGDTGEDGITGGSQVVRP
ncbi:MAG: MBL fold metallo-hydrolase [Solirubrobacteraceae bacterium]|nr:MBL fold metallo-hydrolase [Solirubrobacteraceae bacterium]